MTCTFVILSALLISVMCYLCCADHEEDIQDNETNCPPWFFYNTTTKTCECYSNPSTDHIVKCTEKEALLKTGFCMTYEEGRGFYVNPCENLRIASNLKTIMGDFLKLPNNISDLNDYMCGPMNRQGPKCSQCADGFGLAVLSLDHPCVNCSGVWYGVPLYLFIEFVPLTLFYFTIVFFHINVISAPMVAFIFYSQIAVSTFSDSVIIRFIFNHSVLYHFLKVLISFYGIWNLDFFGFVIPPFCVSPYIKPIHINFLYFISAIYPICLVIMSWMCIRLYSRGFKPIVWFWKKLVQKIQSCCKVDWDTTNKLVDVFATIFLLSYAKLVFASLRTLTNYGITYHLSTNISLHQTLYLTPDPSMIYFGKEHLPFAIVSVFTFSFVAVPIPLLLALYPIESFRVILFKCPIGSRTKTAINIFVRKFHACYRDGTEGGKDMRSLVSIFFFLRVLLSLVSFRQFPSSVSYSIILFMHLACGTLIALAQPYNRTYMNIADSLIFANLALLSLILSQRSGELSQPSIMFYDIIGSILASLPLVVLFGVIILKIIRKIKLLYCKKLFISRHNELDSDDDQLHDYMLHRELPETEESMLSVKEQNEKHSSMYKLVS